jgi:hypothetical protein
MKNNCWSYRLRTAVAAQDFTCPTSFGDSSCARLQRRECDDIGSQRSYHRGLIEGVTIADQSRAADHLIGKVTQNRGQRRHVAEVENLDPGLPVSV